MKLIAEDGKVQWNALSAGATFCEPASTHAAENIGGSGYRMVQFEIKDQDWKPASGFRAARCPGEHPCGVDRVGCRPAVEAVRRGRCPGAASAQDIEGELALQLASARAVASAQPGTPLAAVPACHLLGASDLHALGGQLVTEDAG